MHVTLEIFIHVCICIYIYIHIHMYMELYTCIYIYVCTSTYTFITQKLLVVEGHAPKPKCLGGGLALRQAILENEIP